MTALAHIKVAMNHLGAIAAGGTPSSSEQTDFLAALNNMLAGWQARFIGGVTVATSGSAKTITATAITTYGTISTDNSYPIGWDVAIGYNLAVEISGSLGKGIPAHVAARATETLNAISPNGAVAAAGA